MYDPLIKPKTEEYQKMYEVESHHWWYIGLRYYLFYWIKQFNPTKVLDAGCGTGVNILSAQSAGYDVSGIDYAEDSISFCSKRNLENLRQGVIQQLPYEDSEFDLIYSMDVIGSLTPEDGKKAIAEFYRCLKPGGVLIINTAALGFLYAAQDIAWRIEKRYTLTELNELVENQGFRVIKSTYRVFLLFPLVLISKFVSKFKTMKKDTEAKSDTDRTNPILDAVFSKVMFLEFLLSKYVNLPIGSSAFVVARKDKS